MSLTEESYEGEGGAERRAQRALTDSVGVRLVRPSKSHNLKWRTWTWRFGFRRGAKA
jgi:hypothetical protein